MPREEQTPLARAIARFRKTKGWSHDSMASVLKERYGMNTASRQTIINWEHGMVPQGRYRDALIDMGVPDSKFPVTRRGSDQKLQEVIANLSSLQQEVSQLAETVRRLVGLVDPEQ